MLRIADYGWTLALTMGLVWPCGTVAKESPEDCSHKTKVSTPDKPDLCTIETKDLHPTQFAVGLLAASCKSKTIEKHKRKGDLDDYLKKRPVPLVRGLEDKFYLTDHHHLATAVRMVDKDQKLYGFVQYDFSHAASKDDFWALMINHEDSNGQSQPLAWLRDEKGLGPMDPNFLPKKLDDLRDDPYRTLSRWVRDACGYVKCADGDGTDACAVRTGGGCSGAYFMEFLWADYLRGQLPLPANPSGPVASCQAMPYQDLCVAGGSTTKAIMGLEAQAMRVAAQPLANALPGYNSTLQPPAPLDGEGCETD